MTTAARFAMYVRKSTEDAGESTESQAKACRDLAERRGFEILRDWIVSEEDVSGRVSRPGFDRIVKAAYRRPRPFDGLLIWAISRGARDMALTLELFEAMAANGVQVWRADTGREQSFKTPQDKAMVMLEAYGASDQPFQTGLAVRRELSQKAAKGFQVAGKTFGYKLVRDCQCKVRNCPERGDGHKGHTEREVDKDHAAAVVKMFRLAAEGAGDGRIADRMRDDPAPNARGWTKESIRRALRNELYRGWVTWGRTRQLVLRDEAGRKAYKRERPPRSEWTREYHPGLRIVPEDLWERVQKRKEKTLLLYGNERTLAGVAGKRTGESGVNVSDSVLASIAKCGVCGGSLVDLHKHRGKGRYYCRRRYGKGKCSNSRGIPARLLDDAARSAVHEALADDANVLRLMELQDRRWARWKAGREADRGARPAIEKEISKLRLAVERLKDAIEAGKDVGDRLGKRQAEVAAAEARLAGMPQPKKLAKATLVEKLGTVMRPIATGSTEEVREALRSLGVDVIKVTPLAKGWRIEGVAFPERVIAGGSDASRVNMEPSAPSEASPKDSCAGKAGARRAAVEQRIVRHLD